MFIYENYIWRSTLLQKTGIRHGFSTREGGVSTLPFTASMNLGFHRGDEDVTVLENMARLSEYAGVSPESLVRSPQHHTDIIRYVTADDIGEGIDRPPAESCDGFVTDKKGISLLVRVADCTPVLFAGFRNDGTPVVAAVHAGWRGTVKGIAPKAFKMLVSMGAVQSTICAAIGPCIHSCCYEVGEDFIEAVAEARGRHFADEHITIKDGKYFADIAGMNAHLLLDEGLNEENLDISGECTCCNPSLYHSHRATGGKRGTMGAVIGIV